MGVTLKDIAREVGVSVVTVSKALRDRPDIGDETRRRVLEAAGRLKYRPNLTARSLVTGKSYLIGMVVPGLLHPFFAEVARSMSHALREHGYYVIITSSEEDPETEAREIDQLLGRQLDALVIASVATQDKGFRHIEEQRIPYVLIDRAFGGLATNFVGIDDHAMGFSATEHLIEMGCKQIAHIASAKSSLTQLRERGYRAALTQHGRAVKPSYIVSGETVDVAGQRQGFLAMKKLLSLKVRPDGVFCFNDPMALGAMDCILRAGLRVPEDIAVIGCGNLNYDDHLQVPLSSMDQKTEQIGACTAELLLALIAEDAKRKPTTVVLQAELVRRRSTEHAGSA